MIRVFQHANQRFPQLMSRGCPGGWAALSSGSASHLHLGSSLSECMNCTRLSDMSERLITLEAKVRWLGEPGPGELAGGRGFLRSVSEP